MAASPPAGVAAMAIRRVSMIRPAERDSIVIHEDLAETEAVQHDGAGCLDGCGGMRMAGISTHFSRTIGPMLCECAVSRSAGIRRRWWWALPLALALTLTGAPAIPAAAGSVYRVAVSEGMQPFSHRLPDGTLAGFNVDVMLALCRVLDASCLFEGLPFPEVSEQVGAGSYDFGLANLFRTAERETNLTFSAPYWHSTTVFVGSPGTAAGNTSDRPTRGLVAVVRDSQQHRYAVEHGGPALHALPLDSREHVWEALRSGQASSALVPTMPALQFLRTRQGAGMAILGAPLMDNGLAGGVHIIMPKGRTDLKDRIDHAIQVIREQGVYQDLSLRYFGFDLY